MKKLIALVLVVGLVSYFVAHHEATKVRNTYQAIPLATERI